MIAVYRMASSALIRNSDPDPFGCTLPDAEDDPDNLDESEKDEEPW